MNKKWYNEAIKMRKQWLASAKHDVQFGIDQIVFWKKYLADAKKQVKTYECYIAELEEKKSA